MDGKTSMALKIATVVGARPQFIKAATVSRAIGNHFSDQLNEVLIHTGQHFDKNMSDVFFEEMMIPAPQYNLAISGGEHGQMTGQMMVEIEKILLSENPDCVLVYGDTNSTLAGALCAAKQHIPVAHVEAGLRSFNKKMPEEINRVLTDHISDILFCPTEHSVQNLRNENITKHVYNIGDVMFDAALFYAEQGQSKSNILSSLSLEQKNFILVTLHRAENTDDIERMKQVVAALETINQDVQVVLPLHPRTKKMLEKYDLLQKISNITIDPVSYFDMIILEKSAKLILTDSGGVQKEAFFHKVPCVTIRDETEWLETTQTGWNVLVPAQKEEIISAVKSAKPGQEGHAPYGDGAASNIIAEKVIEILG